MFKRPFVINGYDYLEQLRADFSELTNELNIRYYWWAEEIYKNLTWLTVTMYYINYIFKIY